MDHPLAFVRGYAVCLPPFLHPLFIRVEHSLLAIAEEYCYNRIRKVVCGWGEKKCGGSTCRCPSLLRQGRRDCCACPLEAPTSTVSVRLVRV